MTSAADDGAPGFDALSQAAQDRILAFHEAAHALIAYLLDSAPETVELAPENDDPFCLWSPVERDLNEADDYARLTALVALAGPIGTAMVCEEPDHYG